MQFPVILIVIAKFYGVTKSRFQIVTMWHLLFMPIDDEQQEEFQILSLLYSF
jgi:hypothetical protein